MRRGFTILEVLVASGILAIGCLGVLGMLITTIENNRSSRLRTDAVIIAEQQLADMEAISITLAQPTANINLGANNILQQVRAAPNNGWLAFQERVNAKGIPNQPDGPYFIGVFRLGDTAPGDANFVRGAVRVTWDRNGAINEACRDFAQFDVVNQRSTGGRENCDFVTLPFAFTM